MSTPNATRASWILAAPATFSVDVADSQLQLSLGAADQADDPRVGLMTRGNRFPRFDVGGLHVSLKPSTTGSDSQNLGHFISHPSYGTATLKTKKGNYDTMSLLIIAVSLYASLGLVVIFDDDYRGN